MLQAPANGTVTELKSSTNPATYAQSVTFTAQVDTSGANPSGTVAFQDGSAPIGTGSVSEVTATNNLTYSSNYSAAAWNVWADVGTDYSVVNTISAAPDGSNTATKFSVTGTGAGLVVEQLAPQTSIIGQPFTASVFLRSDGACDVKLGTETSPLWEGNYFELSLTAGWQRYDITYTYTQEGLNASLYVTASPGCTFYMWGAQLERSSTVGPYVATGSAAASGSGGVATFSTNTLRPGSHSISAIYGGDASNSTSTSAAVVQEITNGTVTELRSSINPSVEHQSVTFTGLVHTSGGLPTGTVTFKDGSTTLTSGAITEIAATNQLLHSRVLDSAWNVWTEIGSAVAQVTTAALAPDGTNTAAEFAVSGTGKGLVIEQFVSQAAILGKTFTASVFLRSDGACNAKVGTESSSTWEGDSTAAAVTNEWQRYSFTHTYQHDGTDVSLYVLAEPGCTLYLWGPQLEEASTAGPYVATGATAASGSGGIATLDTTALTIGTHSMTAVYSGDSNFAGSTTPAALTQTVTAPAATTTALESSPSDTTMLGDTVTFTATVSAASGNPTGTVTFMDGSTTIGSGSLTGDLTTLNCGPGTGSTCATLAVGSHSITAVYNGDSLFAGSTSPPLTYTITKGTTTTALQSSASSSGYGSSVTFTATVAADLGGTATGTVTFKDGATTLGTGTLTSGWTALTLSTLTVGSHSITAIYVGDSDFTGSTSPAVTQLITGNVSTTTAVTSSAPTSNYGDTVTFTATVTTSSGGTPTGSITFLDGTTRLGTATLSTDWASLNCGPSQACPILSAGTHSITAVYSGDGNFATSTSPALTPTVNKDSSTTVLTASINPVGFGGTVTFTATVSTATGVATGTVTFKDGTTTVGTGTLNAGWTTLTLSALLVGSHTITAVYGGDANFTGSTSPVLTQVISGNVSTTSAVTSSTNPSGFGEDVTFTATVTASSGGTPTGTVTFKDGATSLGNKTLSSGWATLNTSALSVGSHSITVEYAGDGNYAASTSPLLTQTVNKLATTTIVASSVNPAGFGTAVTFTATIGTTSGGTATGTVTFKDGATTLGTGTLTSGWTTLTTSTLAVGSHSIIAVYGGDGNFESSTSAVLTQSVTGAVTTSTVVASSTNPSNFGDSLTLTATVSASGGTPTGTVTFADGSTNLGTGTLASGWTTLTLSNLTVGTHSLTAAYSGDGNFGSSISTALTQTVNKAATTTALVSSANPSDFGAAVTFTATVSTPSGATATGNVTFKEGNTTVGTGTLSNGWVALTFSTLPVGSHSITAMYAGNATLAASSSSALNQVVTGNVGTTTALAASVNPAVVGVTVTLTATVTPSSGGTPAGTVTFKEGSTVLGTGTLSSGWTTLNISTLGAGSHSITADYGGDSNFAGSISSVLALQISTAATSITISAPSSAMAGASVTLSANVTSTSGTPTGTVTFKDGSTVLGTATLASGSAAFATPALSAGSHSFSAAYGGDTSFAASTSAAASLSVAEDFVVSPPVSGSTVSVRAGQSVTLTLTIAPQTGGFTGPIQFSCSGLPALATCTFSPSSLTPGASPAATTLTIATTAPTVAGLRPMSPWTFLSFYAVFLPFGGVVMIGNVGSRHARIVMLTLLLILVAVLASCGGGGGSSSTPTTPTTHPGTPAGTYTVVVTAQSGSTAHTTNVTLTVQ